MPRDELRTPLRKRSLRERLLSRRPSLFALAAMTLVAVFLAGGAWLLMTPRPLAGEPVVVAAIPPVAELATASTSLAGEPEEVSEEESAAAENVEAVIDQSAAEIKVFDQAAPERQEYQDEAIVFIAPSRPLANAPIADVTETTDAGPLPRISEEGRKPFNVYAQATPLSVSSSGRPKIAIMLGGMGLNAKLTEKAVDALPGDVTLGFAPYGENLQEQVNRARAEGHEIMLQVPMEPVGFPATNPGPKTLMSDASPQENVAALRWHMSRFAGYSGITNYMGARLLVSEEALRPVLAEVRERGLVYLEDATVNVSVSPKVVEQVRLPMQRAQMVIDADPTAPAIAEALERLEQEAIRNGSAIATGSGLEVTIETVAEWAKTLQEKGILLVPLSAAYKGRAT
ncbi:divergent polysaccharide deacetylase family protein [Aestuariivirga sp.]|jgi:polysaccharide deacetylase 2 family uncharacterized protein YibQ|uniref:divergent polysaccharide deacetylase family protein n=1 Tax=Aestuariivirga sp. TaxID=2650926 RepID=UPI0037847EB4